MLSGWAELIMATLGELADSPRKLSVHVLATTKDGTTSALATAKRLIAGLNAQVVLLVPRLTHVGTPFDPSGDERARLIDEYRTLAADVGVHVNALFCVCQRYDDVAHEMLGPSSLLIVGGRKRMLWPTREERLVRRLCAEGYSVVFAQVGARHAVARAPLEAS